jgi:hypothetical protein
MENNFKQEDYDKLVDFLNFIAQKAEFNNWKTEDSIKHFKLLAHMQQSVLPKINAHILEVNRVIKASEATGETVEKDAKLKTKKG